MKPRTSTRVLFAVLIAAIATRANAQQPMVTATPGAQYGASAFHEWLMGSGHRALWQTPVRVPVLNLRTYAGGLRAVKQGGGKQTRTLHLQDRNGREYVFRSVNKDPGRAVPDGLEIVGADHVLQDMTALFHPSGALMVPALLDAVAVLHASPRLYVMPRDERLGKYQQAFAGVLGILEERPEEGPDDEAGFAGSRRIVGTETLLEVLHADSRNRVVEREWLAARLIDFVIGDTDRGIHQWRWARFGNGELYRWRPIPRDRDFAFIHADGVVPRLAGMVYKRLVTFDEKLPSIGTLTFTSIYEDRFFLQTLDATAWQAIAREVQRDLSDRVIESAVLALPPEHQAVSGAQLAATLRVRRDALPDVARAFYEELSEFVDVHGSDQDELVEVRRRVDGGVDVRMFRGGPDLVAAAGGTTVTRSRRPFYDRRFHTADTKEVRIYLGGGDDRAVVSGPNAEDAIKVRVIRGPGNDDVVDSSTDGRGDNQTRIYDEADFTEPEPKLVGFSGRAERFRDWGVKTRISPAIKYRANTGFIVGAQYGRREHGFRMVPYANDWRFKLLWAPTTGGLGLELDAVQHFENSRWSLESEVYASEFDDLRFYGYGNETPEIDRDSATVEWRRAYASGGLYYTTGPTRVGLGARMQISDTPVEAGTPLALTLPLGLDEWTQVGLWTSFESAPSEHAAFFIDGAFYPAAASLSESYGTGRGEAIFRIGSVPQLALRAIGEKIWGDAPYFDAAFIGGRKLLRGYSSYRFAGDAAVVGNAELRFPFRRNTMDVFLLGDAGRVWADGESSGGWHTAYGGGLSLLVGGHGVTATYAIGEDSKFYVTLGHAF